MHLIDKSCTKILPNGGNPATQPDILAVGSVNSSFKCGVNAVGDKVEGGASAHNDRCPWVVAEDEDGSVVRWIVSPPALPVVVGPRPADRSNHVAADDPRSDVVKAARREVIVNPRRAAILAKHLLKGTCGKCPFVQRAAADAKWIVEILVGTGAVAIEGDCETVDAKLGHLYSFPLQAVLLMIRPSAYGTWRSIRWQAYDRAWHTSIWLSRQPHAGDARRPLEPDSYPRCHVRQSPPLPGSYEPFRRRHRLEHPSRPMDAPGGRRLTVEARDDPTHQQKVIYSLTEPALQLVPVIGPVKC